MNVIFGNLKYSSKPFTSPVDRISSLKKREALLHLLLTLLLLTSLPPSSFAAQEQTSPSPGQPAGSSTLSQSSQKDRDLNLTGEERQWLLEHPHIILRTMSSWPPLNFISRRGEPIGIGVDFAKALQNIAGIDIQIEAGQFSDNLAALKKKEADAIMDITPKPEREEYLIFTEPYLQIPHIIAGRKDGPSFEDENDLAGKTIALERGFGNIKYFQTNFPETEIREYDDTEACLLAVSRKEADAYAGNRAVAAYIIAQQVLTNLQIQGKLNKPSSVLTIGVRKDWPLLASIFDKALHSLSDNERQAILTRWAGLNDTIALEPEVILDEKQKTWLKQHPVINALNKENNAPFNFNTDNQAQGYAVAYLNLLARKLGVTVRYEFATDEGDFTRTIREKKFDVIPDIEKTLSRGKYLLFTEPYIEIPYVVVKKTGSPFQQFSDLANRPVAVINDLTLQDIFPEDPPKINISPMATPLATLRAVNSGEVAVALHNRITAQSVINRNLLEGLQIAEEIPITNTELSHLRIGVRNNKPILRDILNAAMASVTVAEMSALQQEWLNPEKETIRKINLTRQEREWLSSHNVFTLGIDPMRSPIEYFNQHGQPAGLSQEILNLLAERLNITFRPIENLSWAGVMMGFENGYIDVLSAATRTVTLDRFADFTSPYISLPLMIFTIKDHPYVSSMDLLGHGVTATCNEYAITEYLQRDWPNLEVLLVDNIEEGLKAVATGKADHYIDTLLTTTYNIQKLGYANIKVAGETPYKYEFSLAVHKGMPYLHAILQKGLNSISDEEYNQILNKWRSIEYEHTFNYSILWRTLAVVVICLAAFFYWNRRLAVEIRERKATEHRLLESERKAIAMSEAIHDGLVMIDHATEVMYWNHAAEKLFGISADEAMGKPIHHLVAPPEDREKFRKGLELFSRSGRGPVVGKLQELIAQRHDGSQFPAEVGVSSFQVEEKWYAVGTIRDISERKEADEIVSKIRLELQQIFDNAMVGIIFTRKDRQLSRYNRKFVEILGYSSTKELHNIPTADLHFSQKEFEDFATRFYPLLIQGEQVQTEYQLKRKDGSGIWCSLVGKALDPNIPSNLDKGIIWVIDDITEKHLAQQALKESEQRIKTILDSINTGIIIIDPETHIITDVNPVAAKMIGLPPDRISGQICHNFICPEDKDSCPIANLQTESVTDEGVLRTKNGYDVPVLKTITPVLLNGKKQLLESFVDLTQQKNTEAELQEKLLELERFYKMTINREEKMIELKVEINHLLEKIGYEQKYLIR